jgi:hypothetical protein
VFSLIGQTAPCADPVVTITGPCTSVTVRDTETGSGFTYATSMSGADTLVVDAGAFTAVLNPTGANTSVLTGVTMYDAQLLEIVPAPQAVPRAHGGRNHGRGVVRVHGDVHDEAQVAPVTAR